MSVPARRPERPVELKDHPAGETLKAPVIELISRTQIKLPARQMRTHSRGQVAEIAKSIQGFGFLVPVVVDEEDVVRAGIGRILASDLLGLRHIPAVRTSALSAAKLRAFALADNRLAEKSRWDREALAAELPELQELLVEENLDISITGFTPVEIDQVVSTSKKTLPIRRTISIQAS